MEATDEEGTLVSRSQNGDHAAFAELIRAHQRMIHSLTFRMTGSLSDAEDLAQETFVRAYWHLPAFRQTAKFSTWLYRIAVNVSLNWKERELRRSTVQTDWAEMVAVAQPAEAFPAETESDHRVQAALLRLPAKQRAAILLTVYEGLNHADAAQALDCSEATVSWRVFSARGKLKRWLSTPLAS